MDLPPPPRSFLRRAMDLPHLRYENVLRPPDFLPPPFPHHLPPPPPPSQTRPLNIHFPLPPSPPPPPPPLPMRHMSPIPHHSRFAFSPPRYPIIERSHRYEFDPPPKPYFPPTLLPPPLPPPPPPRENVPLRIVHDYPKRNLVFENENYSRCRIDNMHESPENWDRDMHWGVHGRVPETDRGGRDRYRDVSSESFELYRKREDGWRWDSGLTDWGSDLDRRRDYDDRRWNSRRNDPVRDLYRECDYDERRWDSGMNNRIPDLYREPSFDERRWDIGINNQGRKLYIQVDDDERRRDSSRSAGVLSRLGNRQPELSEDDLRLGGVLSRLRNRQTEFAEDDLSSGGVLSRLRNRQQEFADDDPSLGRFSGRLGTGISKGEFIWPDKKKRLQKKNTSLRNQFGKVRSRHSGGFKPQYFANDSSRGSFKVKERGSAKMQTRMEVKRKREQSPMDLAISFKSNALVAKAIQVPSHPATELSVRSNSVKEGMGCNLSALPAAKQDVSDFQFHSQETTKEDKGGTKQHFLGANLHMERDNHGIKVDAYKPLVPKLKRKRSNLNRRPALSHVAHNVITKCSGRGEGLVTTTDDADCLHQLRADGVAHYAHENLLPKENAGYGDSLGFNQGVIISNKYGHDKASVCDADTGPIKPVSQYIRLDSNTEDDVSKQPNLGKTMKMKEDAIVSDVGIKDANSENFFQNQADMPQVMLDAKHFRSLEGAAVTECPNVAFDIPVSSCVLSANKKETFPEFEASFSDNLGSDLSHNVYSVEGSPEMMSGRETCLSLHNSFPKVINDKETCVSVGHLSKVIRKRKHRGAQMGLSSKKTNGNFETVSFIDGGVTWCLAKDIVPAMDGDFVGEKDRCKEVTCLEERPSGVEDSVLDVHFTASGSFPGYRKKQKLSSPRSSLSSLSEDDTIADGFSNPLILEQQSTRPSELGAERSGNTSSASITITKCRTTDMRGEVGINDLTVAKLDENLVDGDISLGSEDLALIARGITCSDRNAPSAADSGDELLASSFDMRSCMSSPEGLHFYSDSCFLENTKTSACLSDTEMICRSDKISNKKHVFADPNTSSFGRCLEAAVNKSQTNPGIPQSLLKDTSQVVKKLYPVHSKLTWSKDQVPSAVTKAFPVQHPVKFNNTGKSYSSHATKSRTWCRTVDSTAAVAEPKVNSLIPQSNATKAARTIQSSYIRKGNSLLRKHSLSDDTSHGFPGSSCSVYRLSPCTNTIKNDLASDCKTGNADAPTLKRTEQVNTSEVTKALTQNRSGNSLSCSPCNLEEPLSVSNPQSNDCPFKTLDVMEESVKSSLVPECRTDSVINSDSQSTAAEGNSEKKIIYVKKRSYQLVATSNSDDMVDNTQSQLSDGYYKSRENQLLRASPENHVKRGNENTTASGLVPHSIIPKTSTRRQSGFAKTFRYSKFSFVWKLHDTQSPEKHKNSLGPRKVWPHLLSPKRAVYWRNLVLGIKPSLSSISQKLLLSRKRGAMYTRSSHGYSLRMSKVLSVGGSSLKWSKSIEKSSRKANEEATRAVAAAEKRKKEEKGAVYIASKSRNHVSRKWVLSVKLRPGERIFRVGSERYRMDPTRRTLQRITAEKESSSSSSSSVALQSKKNVKRSYIPRRLLIGNEEYVRIGNGNQLIRDPKKRVRVLASEKVRWSLRTARLRLARKRKYCQFFTRFGKCNKHDGKCPYIHDPSKIVVCTKFLTGSCTNINCKLTHKVIPERMQDCSYFLKGSCSNENCPYRHVHVNPDSSVCESFLRGYCADGNECQKKHTYVCPAFEATGVCAQASTCKLHHPKKKTEKKPTVEQKIVRGRYFDGGLVGVDDWSTAAAPPPPVEKLSSKGKDDIVEGQFPDYISLEVSDDEADQALVLEKVGDEILPDAHRERS